MFYLSKHLPGNTSDSKVNGKQAVHIPPSGKHCWRQLIKHPLEQILGDAKTSGRRHILEGCVCTFLSLYFPYLNGSKPSGGFVENEINECTRGVLWAHVATKWVAVTHILATYLCWESSCEGNSHGLTISPTVPFLYFIPMELEVVKHTERVSGRGGRTLRTEYQWCCCLWGMLEFEYQNVATTRAADITYKHKMTANNDNLYAVGKLTHIYS